MAIGGRGVPTTSALCNRVFPNFTYYSGRGPEGHSTEVMGTPRRLPYLAASVVVKSVWYSLDPLDKISQGIQTPGSSSPVTPHVSRQFAVTSRPNDALLYSPANSRLFRGIVDGETRQTVIDQGSRSERPRYLITTPTRARPRCCRWPRPHHVACLAALARS